MRLLLRGDHPSGWSPLPIPPLDVQASIPDTADRNLDSGQDDVVNEGLDMSGTFPPQLSPDIDQDRHEDDAGTTGSDSAPVSGEWLNLREAAVRMATTPEALRKRAQRKRVQARKAPDDGAWLIFVQDVPPPSVTGQLPTTGQDAATVELVRLIASQQDWIADQAAQIADLRVQATRWEERARALTSQLAAIEDRSSTPVMSAGPAQTVAADTSEGEVSAVMRDTKRPSEALSTRPTEHVSWWRRLFG